MSSNSKFLHQTLLSHVLKWWKGSPEFMRRNLSCGPLPGRGWLERSPPNPWKGWWEPWAHIQAGVSGQRESLPARTPGMIHWRRRLGDSLPSWQKWAQSGGPSLYQGHWTQLTEGAQTDLSVRPVRPHWDSKRWWGVALEGSTSGRLWGIWWPDCASPPICLPWCCGLPQSWPHTR